MKTNLLIIVLVAFLSCGRTGPDSSQHHDTNSMNAFCFLALGDSYTIGESVQEQERWPVQLTASLRDQKVDVADPLIIARTGWTTDELDAAIDKENPKGPFDLVTLLIGVNNQYRGRSEEEYREQFRGLLQRAIGFAGNEPPHIIVLSIPDWGMTPFAEGRDRVKIGREIDRFNSINREETEHAGAQYVDVTPISREVVHDRLLVAADGLHPSGKMYAEWARLAFPSALKILKPSK